MKSESEYQPLKKTKGALFRVIILLLIVTVAGIVSWFVFLADTPEVSLVLSSYRADTAENIKIKKVVLSTLQHDIDAFNSNAFVPGSQNFFDGESSLNNSFAHTAYLVTTDSSFTIDMGDASFLTTPTIVDTILYSSGGFSSKAFFAFSANTGKVIWSADISDDGPSSAITTDSLVLFNTESCTLFALNRFTGQHVWSKWIGDPLLTHPVTDGQYVYTAYPAANQAANMHGEQFKKLPPSHAILAMDVHTGKVIWQRWLDGDVMTTPILDNGNIYLTTFKGTLYKLSAADGKILTASLVNATSLPNICGDKIYTTQRRLQNNGVYEAIVALDKNTFALLNTFAVHKAPYLDYEVQKMAPLKNTSNELDARNGFATTPNECGWQNAAALIGQSNVSSLQNFTGSTVVTEGNNLYSCFGNEIICIDANNGKTTWEYPLPTQLAIKGGHSATTPIVIGNNIIVVTSDGDVLLLDKTNGNLSKKYATHAAVRNQPIVDKGRIFMPSATGKLIAIDTKQKDLAGYKMFMKNNAHNTQKRN